MLVTIWIVKLVPKLEVNHWFYIIFYSRSIHRKINSTFTEQ